MKKIILTLVATAALQSAAFAQNITADNTVLEYKVTEVLSLGTTYVNGIGGGKKINAGKVGDVISFNTKTQIMKLAGNKINYKIEEEKSSKFPQTSIVRCAGFIPGNGGDVSFQVLDKFGEGIINLVISWPDYSNTRYIATLVTKKEL